MALKLLLLVSLTIVLGSPEELPPEKRLIKYKANEPATWMTPAEIENLFRTHRFGYLDLTHEGADDDTAPKTGKGRKLLPEYTYPDHPLQEKVLNQLFPQLDKNRLEGSVRNLSSYPNRHPRRSFGKSSVEGWLTAEITSILADYDGRSSIISVKDYYLDLPPPYKGYKPYLQQNWIVKLEGQDPKLQSELVILGAHYDTIWGTGNDPMDKKANATLPGADDNASCVAVLLEVLRLLVKNGAKLKYSIEFHFYTAKETGLLGSNTVVAKYHTATVRGMLNLDTCGFGKTIGYAEETLWSAERETSEPLTQFVKMLADNYVGKEFEVKKFECDPNCFSDHYPWTRKSFHSAYFFEYELIPRDRWHSEMDTVEHVNFELVNEFAKLALAFVIELGELESTCICGGGKLGGGWAQVGISLLLVMWII